jgi:spoIIIJ-associated protein
MEWVEITGKTVEAALDTALDTLGVDEDEVEYEVLEAPRGGLFGRRDARIRARVRPISREKPGEGRRRSRRTKEDGARAAGGSRRGGSSGAGSGGGGGGDAGPRGRRRRSGRTSPARGPRPEERVRRAEREQDREATVSEVPVDEQAREAESFTRGLIEAFGAPATVETKVDEEGGVLVDVTGRDLGYLVGPRGATLQAIEELVRTVVQRRTEGHGTRINVDVAGYRAKRREALARFTEELAEQVRASGRDQALEPMSAADRKVVHDTIATLDGVTTESEGEEPRRRVVVRPA